MSCFPELNYAIYVDGELNAEEARQVERHLAGCARCQALVDALRAENLLLAEVLGEAEPQALLATPRPTRPVDIFWTGLAVLSAAAGLHAALEWVGRFRPPPGTNWVNPFSPATQLNLFFTSLFYLIEEGVAMLLSSITIVSAGALALLVVAGGVFLLRRRPTTATVLVVLVLALALPLPGAALETRKAPRGAVTVPKDETIDDSLLAFGQTVIIDGVVTGNLIAFAERVEVNGTIEGDVVCFGRDIPINGTVDGNVYSFARRVDVGGRVARSLYAFAQRTAISSKGSVKGDVVAFSAEAEVQGNVGRDVAAFAGSTHVRGTIGRNLVARTGRLTLVAPARVGGDLTAYTEKAEAVQIDAGVTVAGETRTHLREPRPSRYTRPKFYLWRGVWLAAAFLTGLLFYWLFPAFFASQLDTAGALLRTIGIGFLALVATPIAAIIAAITILGLPIALLALATWVAGLYLAHIFVAGFIGQSLRRSTRLGGAEFALALLIGLVIVFVAVNLPYVGGWIRFLVILLGLGIAVSQGWRSWQRTQAAA